MICSLPWVHLSLQARDDAVGIRPCCWYLHSSVKKEFPNQWLTYNDVKRIGLTEASNSQVLKKTRQDMLAGKHVSGCQSCYDNEKIGNVSMRQNFNAKFKLDNLTEDFLHLKYIEISLDNICNLECKMCNSGFSTKLKKRDELVGYEVSPNLAYDLDLLNTINLDNVEVVKVLGGEPFASKNHEKLLDKFQDLSKISFIYNTNCTIIPPDNIIKKMQSMKGLRFIISCDSIYKYNDYQRWGSKFEDIIANAITLKKTFSNINHFMFLNVYSLLNLNTYNISKKWFSKNGFKTSSEWERGELSAWHAPQWYEDWILEENDCDEVRNYFSYRQYNENKWKQFLKFINITDKLYNTKLKYYNPELARKLEIHESKGII